MTHDMVKSSEDAQSVTFACSKCKKALTFAKPGFGDPVCEQEGIDFQIPKGGRPVDDWVGDCG